MGRDASCEPRAARRGGTKIRANHTACGSHSTPPESKPQNLSTRQPLKHPHNLHTAHPVQDARREVPQIQAKPKSTARRSHSTPLNRSRKTNHHDKSRNTLQTCQRLAQSKTRDASRETWRNQNPCKLHGLRLALHSPEPKPQNQSPRQTPKHPHNLPTSRPKQAASCETRRSPNPCKSYGSPLALHSTRPKPQNQSTRQIQKHHPNLPTAHTPRPPKNSGSVWESNPPAAGNPATQRF